MNESGNQTETAQPAPAKEQLDNVDKLLRSWVMAGASLLERSGDPCYSVSGGKWKIKPDAIVRMLRNLAHLATLVRMQDLVTGRKSADDGDGPYAYATGFLLAAKAVDHLAIRAGEKEVAICKGTTDPHEYATRDWNEIEKAREHVVAEIERIAPGWYALAQDKAREGLDKLRKAKTRTYDSTARVGSTLNPFRPDDGFAASIAARKAGIRPRGLGEIRLDKVTRLLWVDLGCPEELLARNYEKARERIKAELAKGWADKLITFIGEYEGREGERLSDNEIRYLRDLVNGDMDSDRRMGYARLVGAEKRNVGFTAEDLRQPPDPEPEHPITAETIEALIEAIKHSGAPVLTQAEVDRIVDEGCNDDRPIGAPFHN